MSSVQDANDIPASTGFKIFRYDSTANAEQLAEELSVVDQAVWSSYGIPFHVFSIANLIGITSDDAILEELRHDRKTLREWAAQHVNGNLMRPLENFLEWVHARWLGPDSGYEGYQINIETQHMRQEDWLWPPHNWHSDDYADALGLEPQDPEPLRVVTALHGKGEAFMINRAAAWEHYGDDDWLEEAERCNPQSGELAAYYSEGSEENGLAPPAMHATPDFIGDRIVVHLTLGSKEQVELINKCKEDRHGLGACY